MAQAAGSDAQLLGGIKESAYGTSPADTTAAVKLPIISCAIKSDQKSIESKVIRSRRDAAKPYRGGNISVAGPVVVPVDAINIGYWLSMLFGLPTEGGGAGPTYTHTWKVGSSLPSWVLEVGYTDIGKYQLLNGCKADSMSLSFDQASDAELDATIQIVGAKETLNTSSMDASPTTQAYSPFTINDLALTEGGSSIATVQSLSIDQIGNNLDQKNGYLIGGAGVRGQLKEGFCVANGKLKVIFEDWTLYNKAVNSTESSLVATLTSGANVLTIKLNELFFDRNAPGIQGPEGIFVELPWNAFYDNHSDNSIVVVSLVNSLATYPT